MRETIQGSFPKLRDTDFKMKGLTNDDDDEALKLNKKNSSSSLTSLM